MTIGKVSNQEKANRFNFTVAKLKSLPVPTGSKRQTYHDTTEKGLVVILTPKGTKSFYLYRKLEGKPERVFIGHYPDLSIENARKKAAALKGEIAQGANPQRERKQLREETTFGELFAEYMERYSKKQKRSWIYDEREVNKFLSHWFKRKISSITKHEIQQLHEKTGDENGIYQANRLLERIKAIYNKAIEWGWKGINPATGIKKFKEKSRDRFLQADEAPRFFEALAEEEAKTRDFFLLSLLTGARKSNTLAMKWSDINFERGEWRIPLTKSGDPLTVSLSSKAIEILEGLKVNKSSPWVFPSETSKSGHLQDPKKAWKRILLRAEIFQLMDLLAKANSWSEERVEEEKKQALGCLKTTLTKYRKEAIKQGIETENIGLQDLRIHDLRRTLGSWQAATGATTAIIAKTLGHKHQQTTKIYERLNLDPVRDAVETAANALFDAGKK